MVEEIPLPGGRVTSGVVRIGDTVRRPVGPNSTFVQALLRHLESVGFPYAPRFLGLDSKGRQILTFVEGWVPPDLGHFSESQIRQAARIIAAFHEATSGTPIAGDQEVVCHHDLSPCNFVFRSGVPQCLIDFDAAAPGARRLDVGYATWAWLDIGNADVSPNESGQRLAAMLHAYGPLAPADPIAAILDAQRRLAERAVGSSEFAERVRCWAERCGDWVRDHRDAIEAGLVASGGLTRRCS